MSSREWARFRSAERWARCGVGSERAYGSKAILQTEYGRCRREVCVGRLDLHVLVSALLLMLFSVVRRPLLAGAESGVASYVAVPRPVVRMLRCHRPDLNRRNGEVRLKRSVPPLMKHGSCNWRDGYPLPHEVLRGRGELSSCIDGGRRKVDQRCHRALVSHWKQS